MGAAVHGRSLYLRDVARLKRRWKDAAWRLAGSVDWFGAYQRIGASISLRVSGVAIGMSLAKIPLGAIRSRRKRGSGHQRSSAPPTR